VTKSVVRITKKSVESVESEEVHATGKQDAEKKTPVVIKIKRKFKSPASGAFAHANQDKSATKTSSLKTDGVNTLQVGANQSVN